RCVCDWQRSWFGDRASRENPALSRQSEPVGRELGSSAARFCCHPWSTQPRGCADGKGGAVMAAATVLSAVQQIRRMRGGSQSHLMRASDGNYYITKFQNNPQDVRVLANEFFASKLGSF